MMVIKVPARGCLMLLCIVVSMHKLGGARLCLDRRTAAPGVVVNFDIATREVLFDFMNSFQNDAHVSLSTNPRRTAHFVPNRSASLSHDQLLSSPIVPCRVLV